MFRVGIEIADAPRPCGPAAMGGRTEFSVFDRDDSESHSFVLSMLQAEHDVYYKSVAVGLLSHSARYFERPIHRDCVVDGALSRSCGLALN